MQEGLRDATKSLARIALKAGAKSVTTLHANAVQVNSEAEISKLDEPGTISQTASH